MIVLRALDVAGNEFYYTGKAGKAWVSKELSEAFIGYNLEGGRAKASGFNQFKDVHGLWFIAVTMHPHCI